MWKPEILNLVNCYNNEKELFRYAEMLSGLEEKEKLMLAVNINSISDYTIDEFAEKLAEKFKNCIIFTSNKNIGYLNGMLFAYRSLEKNTSISLRQCKYILMSNTDIIINQYNFFSMLLKRDYQDVIGCIAPSIYTIARGTYENPQRLFRYSLRGLNRRIFIFSHPKIAYLYFKLAELKSKKISIKKQPSSFVYSAHGCFFILSKDFFNKIKDQDYGYLMYSEEAYIAEKIIQYGFKVFYDSELEVNHLESTVTKFLGIKKKSKMFSESLEYIRDSFF